MLNIMATIPFQQEQLDIVITIAQHRPAFLDPIFLFLNYFDSPYFAALLIPFVWFGFSPRWGLKIAYLFLATGILNHYLKYSFGWPRPTAAMPDLGMFFLKSPGFPSGGAQTAFLLGALLIYQYRNWAAWLVGTFYILLISFSRLYLGVHYPLDLLGGWIAGAALFLLFIAVEKPIDHWIAQKKPWPLWFKGSLLPLSLCFLFLYPLAGAILAMSLGALIAFKHNLYLPAPPTFLKGCLKGSAAAVLTFLFCALMMLIIPYGFQSILTPILLGFWVSLAMALLFKKLPFPTTRRN